MREEVRSALDAGAIGLASSFSPNHSGHGGLPMPSTIAGDAEIRALAGVLGDAKRGVFMMATGPRATPEFMEAIAAANGRPAFISTVLTMYNEADPARGLTYYEQCAAALARGHEVYIQTSCQPLSFDFTLEDPYLLLTHSAFDRVSKRVSGELADIYRDPEFRRQFRADLASPRPGILFYGNWAMVEVDGKPVTAIAAERGVDPLDCFFDIALEQNLKTRFVAKLFQNVDAGVAPLLQHEAGVVALSDAGAHLIFMCDAGFGLHFLEHWVRETGTFTLAEGVRKLTSDPARQVPHPRSRAHRARRVGRPAAVRSGQGGVVGPGEIAGPAGRRVENDPQARGSGGRVGERRAGVRREGVREAGEGAGEGAGPV